MDERRQQRGAKRVPIDFSSESEERPFKVRSCCHAIVDVMTLKMITGVPTSCA
jgi:hypothetical protein